MISNVQIVEEQETIDKKVIYMVQDLKDFSIYERAKAIVNFCDKETKNLEKVVDRALLDIFNQNGINIPNTSKSVLKKAFATLKENNKGIIAEDLYWKNEYYNLQPIKITPLFRIWLEENRFLQCGVMIEIKHL